MIILPLRVYVFLIHRKCILQSRPFYIQRAGSESQHQLLWTGAVFDWVRFVVKSHGECHLDLYNARLPFGFVFELHIASQ